MEESKPKTVDDTVRIFDLQVEQQMLPNGSNPIGRGNLLRNSESGLSYEDIPRLVLGHVHEAGFSTEDGQEVAFEKIARHGCDFERSDDEELQDGGSYEEMKKRWEELRIAKNKSKFDPKTLKLVRDELDNLMKKAEGNLDSSGASTSTWASFAPPPEEKPICKIIKNYTKMSDEQKVDALKNELPPFNIDDVKYANLKFALAPDTKPPFDARQIADQMLYYEIYAVKEQPEWRKKLIREHGPAGVSYDGYNNYSNAALWQWDWSSFGGWSVDVDGKLKFDGKHFWKRTETGRRKKVQLEEWLTEIMEEKNPDEFKDGKWRYKKMYCELINIMEVRVN